MIRRRFGPTGIDVSVIGQGTWQLKTPKGAAQALRVGLELGLNHIDTAELYTGSEEVIRDAIAGRSRDGIFLVSKVLPRNASRKGVVEHCKRSLARLGVERLDVYLLHWIEDIHPLEESLQGLADAVDQGLTRFLGVSNFDVESLDRARSLVGKHKVVCDQVYYSLSKRGLENDLLPYCRKNGIALVGYSPFDSGPFEAERSQHGAALRRVAERHGATTRQVVLNLLARDPAVFMIPKAEKDEHVRENAASLDFTLAPEDVEELEAAFPRPPPGPLAMI